MELKPSAQSFLDTRQKLLKNRNYKFPVFRYFTWKLEFVSEILWMMVAYFFVVQEITKHTIRKIEYSFNVYVD